MLPCVMVFVCLISNKSQARQQNKTWVTYWLSQRACMKDSFSLTFSGSESSNAALSVSSPKPCPLHPFHLCLDGHHQACSCIPHPKRNHPNLEYHISTQQYVEGSYVCTHHIRVQHLPFGLSCWKNEWWLCRLLFVAEMTRHKNDMKRTGCGLKWCRYRQNHVTTYTS